MSTRTRLDFDSAQAGPMGPFGPGDYLLSLDSGRIIAVNPGTKAYVDGFSMMANAMPQELMSQAAITNVSVTVERLGAGDVIEGRPTERYGMVAQYTLRLMGQSMSIANESDLSTAQLTASINTPFTGMLPKGMATGPFSELYAKID